MYLDSSYSYLSFLTLYISKVTIDGFGSNSVSSGGGIYATGDMITRNIRLHVSEVIIKSCAVGGSGMDFGYDYEPPSGGGLSISFSNGGYITHSHFMNNVGSYGAGVFLYNTTSLDISYSDFIGNQAVDYHGYGYGGGASMIGSSHIQINHVTFSRNSGRHGAGISIDTSTAVTFQNSTWTGNSATYNGGGIWVACNPCPQILSCNFVNNTAISYGGAVNAYLYDGDSLYVIDTTFINNSASPYPGQAFLGRGQYIQGGTGYGGGLRVVLEEESYVKLHISRCNFRGNFAQTFGGGIGVFGNLDVSTIQMIDIFIDNTTIYENTALHSGGGIFILDYISVLLKMNGLSSVNDNEAYNGYGGAIYFPTTSGNFVKLKGATFAGNSAGESGGALYLSIDSYLSISSCKFIGNNIIVPHGVLPHSDFESYSDLLLLGGAIYINRNVTLNSADSIFAENTGGLGGAIFCNVSNTLNLINTTFSGNAASLQGGALYASLLNTISTDTVRAFENRAEGVGLLNGFSGGGAFALFNLNQLDMASSIFKHNFVSSGGGGAIGSNSQNGIYVADTIFQENTANGGGKGGAFDAGQLVQFMFFFNCTFIGNKAPASSCGALSIGEQSSATIGASRFEDNSAGLMGGALCLTRTTGARILRSTFSNNKAMSETEGSGGALYIYQDSGTILNNCDLVGNYALLGSAIFIDSTGSGRASPSPPNITANFFGSNRASGAGTVLWLAKSPGSLHSTTSATTSSSSNSLDRGEPLGLTNVADVSVSSLDLMTPPEAVREVPSCPGIHVPVNHRVISSSSSTSRNKNNTCTFEAVGPLYLTTLRSTDPCTTNFSINNVAGGTAWRAELIPPDSRSGSQGETLVLDDSWSCDTSNKNWEKSSYFVLPLSSNSNYTLVQTCTDTVNPDAKGGNICNIPPFYIFGYQYLKPARTFAGNVWINNSAPFGSRWATQPIKKMIVQSSGGGNSKGGSVISLLPNQGSKPDLPIPITVNYYTVPVVFQSEVFLDYYDQSYRGTATSLAFFEPTISIGTPYDDKACSPRLPGRGVIGAVIAGINSSIVDPSGGAVFSVAAEILCFPRKSMVVNITRQFPGYLREIYTTYRVSFRACLGGEYLKDGKCTVCNPGSYSLEQDPNDWTQTQCLACPDSATCTLGTVEANPGHWRSGPLSGNILVCPQQRACQGGLLSLPNSTATMQKMQQQQNQHQPMALTASAGTRTNPDATLGSGTWPTSSPQSLPVSDPNRQCTEGYEGPLCSVCSAGYFKTGRRCVSCSNQQSALAVDIVVPALLFFVIGAVGLYVKSIRHNNKVAQEMNDFNTFDQGSPSINPLDIEHRPNLKVSSSLFASNVNAEVSADDEDGGVCEDSEDGKGSPENEHPPTTPNSTKSVKWGGDGGDMNVSSKSRKSNNRDSSNKSNKNSNKSNKNKTKNNNDDDDDHDDDDDDVGEGQEAEEEDAGKKSPSRTLSIREVFTAFRKLPSRINFKKLKEVGIPKLKIMLTLFQIVGGLPEALDVNFPDSMQGLLSLFKATNAVTPTGSFFQCQAGSGSRGWDYVHTLMLVTLVPIALSLLLVLVCAVHIYMDTYHLRPPPQTSNTKKEKPGRYSNDGAFDKWMTYTQNKSISVARQGDDSKQQEIDEREDELAKQAYEEKQEMMLQQQRNTQRLLIVNRLFHIYIFLFLFLTFLVLPRVTVIIFQAFSCVDIGLSDKFLRADMSIVCYSPRYNFGRNFAGVMCLVYPIGVPCLYCYLLYSNRRAIRTRKTEEDNEEGEEDALTDRLTFIITHRAFSIRHTEISFLWSSYKKTYWNWELVEVFRRLLFTAVLSVIKPGTSLQIVIGIALVEVFVYRYGHVEPFPDEWDDFLVELSQHQVRFILMILYDI